MMKELLKYSLVDYNMSMVMSANFKIESTTKKPMLGCIAGRI